MLINSILKHPKHDFMLANVDGIVDDSINRKCIFEAKTASAYKQDQWKNEDIPEAYMLQIQHYLWVTGYAKAYIAALIGGNIFTYKVIDRDDELISEKKDQCVNKLKLIMENNEIGIINDTTITWKDFSSERLDTKKLKEEVLDIYKKYIKKITLRRFMIK